MVDFYGFHVFEYTDIPCNYRRAYHRVTEEIFQVGSEKGRVDSLPKWFACQFKGSQD